MALGRGYPSYFSCRSRSCGAFPVAHFNESGQFGYLFYLTNFRGVRDLCLNVVDLERPVALVDEVMPFYKNFFVYTHIFCLAL